MLHMTQEIYFKTCELGKLIAESEDFKAMKAAEDIGATDPDLAACVDEYVHKRGQLEEETAKDDKDFALIGAYTRELDEISERMNALPAYHQMMTARANFDAMMQAIADIIQSTLNPEASGCSGDCSKCSGCSH